MGSSVAKKNLLLHVERKKKFRHTSTKSFFLVSNFASNFFQKMPTANNKIATIAKIHIPEKKKNKGMKTNA